MKKLFLLLAISIQGIVFAQETKTELKTRFDVIRNESIAGANTKTRVANAYQELSDGSIGVYPVNAIGTDTYTGSLLGLDAYSGRIVFTVFANNNTGASTFNINTNGVVNIQKYDDGWTSLEADDIVAGKLYRLYHDGTRFQIDLGGSGGGGSVNFANNGLSLSGDTVQWGGVTNKKIEVNGDFGIEFYAQPPNKDYEFIVDPISQSTQLVAAENSGNQIYNEIVISTSASNFWGKGIFNESKGGVYSVKTDTAGGAGINRFLIDSTGTTTFSGDTILFTGNLIQNDTLSKIAAFDYLTGQLQWVDASAFVDSAENLTGITLNSTIVNSSLTSVGTLTDLTVTNPINGTTTFNALLYPTARVQSGTADTLKLTDAGNYVRMTSSSANTILISNSSSIDFPNNAGITIQGYGSGETTIVADAGVTIRSSSGVLTEPAGDYSPMVLVNISGNEWYLWNGLPSSSGQALTKTDDTNVTLTLGGTPTTALLQPASLTLGWNGTLAASRGGTGSSSGAWLLSGSSTITTPTITGKPTWTQSSESSSNTFQTFTQAVHTGGTPTGITYTGGGHTTLANAETNDLYFNGSRTVQFGQNTLLAIQRSALFDFNSLVYSSSAGTKTITTAIGLAVKDGPTAGTNVTITNGYPFAVTDGSNTVEASFNKHNINYGALVLGSVTRANAPSIGAATNGTTFNNTGTCMKFQTGSMASDGRVGFNFTTSQSNVLANSNSFISSTIDLGSGTAGITKIHSHFNSAPNINPTAGTSYTVNMFSSNPTINVGASVTGASIVGFRHDPVLTALNNAINYSFISTSGKAGFGTTAPEDDLEIQGAEGLNASLILDADDGDDNADTWKIRSEASANDLTFTNHTTKYLDLTSDGRLYGTALHNNAGAMTGTTNQYIGSGTYTPTLDNTTNVSASTPYACQWTRVGNVVDVSGEVDLDATTTLTLTVLGISLPPPTSNIANSNELAGTASNELGDSGRVSGNVANDRAEIRITPVSVSNDRYSFKFSYVIL